MDEGDIHFQGAGAFLDQITTSGERDRLDERRARPGESDGGQTRSQAARKGKLPGRGGGGDGQRGIEVNQRVDFVRRAVACLDDGNRRGGRGRTEDQGASGEAGIRLPSARSEKEREQPRVRNGASLNEELAAADRIADVELIERDVGIQQDEIIPLDVVGEIGHIARSRSQRRRDAHQIGETGTGRRPVGGFIPVKRPGVDVVPSVVGGACGVGPGDGKERGGDHQGRAGKKGTGLRTFHFNKFGEVTGK